MVAIGVAVIIAVVGLIVFAMLQRSDDDNSTGILEVRYNSMTGDDVKIYIDDELKGTYPSNQSIKFFKMSTGIHSIRVYDLADRNLASGKASVTASGVTTMELP